MKFGVRDICNVVFRAKSAQKIGTTTFDENQPVLMIDTATASTLEQAATTVYAQGGRGNARLIAWEGEKTLTFTVTDALLSPIGFSILSGAGLFKEKITDGTQSVHVHMSTSTTVGANGVIDLKNALIKGTNAGVPVYNKLDETTGTVFVSKVSDGSIVDKYTVTTISDTNHSVTVTGATTGDEVIVDYYIIKDSDTVNELQIDASNFAGNYYVEAETLFRRQKDGKDVPCIITIPNAKIQSNFTFSMAATGDPSTFDFTMDAFPDYTMFDRSHKVLCVLQIVEDAVDSSETHDSVMKHLGNNL